MPYNATMTVNIEVKHEGVLNLFSEMERLNLIQINTRPNSASETKERISKQYAGALRLSDSAYEAMQKSLQENRSEWNSDIF
jgi:hypothetical protein